MDVKQSFWYGLTALPKTAGALLTARGRRARAALTLPLTLVAFLLTLLAAYLVWRGWCYPLAPDTYFAIGHPFTPDARLDGSWGGNRLIGAWFIHAMVGLGMQLVCLWLVRGIAAVQRATEKAPVPVSGGAR
jgi:hypothetical protein